MKFKIKDTALLKHLVNSVSIVADEVTMKISEGGLLIRTMDPSRVAMVDLDVTKAVFEEWDCKEDLKFGVNLSELMKLLKRSGKEDETTIEWDKNTGKLKVTIVGKYSKVYTLPTLEPSEEEMPEPKISFNAKVKFVTDNLKSVLEDALLVSDHMRMTTVDDGLEVDATGDLMTAHLTLNKQSGILDFAAKEQCKATASLKYMMDIMNAAISIADIGVLEYSTDMPFKFTFNKDEVIKLTYYIAPRIETD